MASTTKISLLFASFALIFAIRGEASPAKPIPDRKNSTNQGDSEIPKITECVAIPIKVNGTYLKWKTYDPRHIIAKYSLWYHLNGTQLSSYIGDSFDAKGRSDYFLESTEFKKGEVYDLGIDLIHSNGTTGGNCLAPFRALIEDLVLKPFVNESTNTSIIIGWILPNVSLPEHYCQQLEMNEVNSTSNRSDCSSFSNSSSIPDLKPDTKYLFAGRICIANTTHCGDWSTATEYQTTSSSPSSSPFSSSISSSNFHSSKIVNLVAVMTLSSLHFFFKLQ